MPTNRLYDTWKCRILELRPGQRITQVRIFVWLMVGIFQSRSVCLSRIAGKIPGSAKLLSTNWLRLAGPSFDASLALEFLGFRLGDVREGLDAVRNRRPPEFDR